MGVRPRCSEAESAGLALQFRVAAVDVELDSAAGFSFGALSVDESGALELGVKGTVYVGRSVSFTAGINQINIDGSDIDTVDLRSEIFVSCTSLSQVFCSLIGPEFGPEFTGAPLTQSDKSHQ